MPAHYREKAAAVRESSEQEQMVYDESLNLEDDILTDQEDPDGCGSGTTVVGVERERLRCEQNWARYRRDHPKFTQKHQASEVVNSRNSFHRFHDLPPEIKAQICRYVLRGRGDGNCTTSRNAVPTNSSAAAGHAHPRCQSRAVPLCYTRRTRSSSTSRGKIRRRCSCAMLPVICLRGQRRESEDGIFGTVHPQRRT